MSRSYKKTPWCGDKKAKQKKRIANHTVRRYLKNNMDLMGYPQLLVGNFVAAFLVRNETTFFMMQELKTAVFIGSFCSS